MLIGLIGPVDETWDICFIAEYPSVESFLSMQKDETYRKAVKHRQIAVRTSRLIRMAPKTRYLRPILLSETSISFLEIQSE